MFSFPLFGKGVLAGCPVQMHLGEDEVTRRTSKRAHRGRVGIGWSCAKKTANVILCVLLLGRPPKEKSQDIVYTCTEPFCGKSYSTALGLGHHTKNKHPFSLVMAVAPVVHANASSRASSGAASDVSCPLDQSQLEKWRRQSVSFLESLKKATAKEKDVPRKESRVGGQFQCGVPDFQHHHSRSAPAWLCRCFVC